MPIKSFADTTTESFYQSGRVKKGIGWASISAVARRKIDMLSYAVRLDDLKSPPGNRLEALSGKLKGFHSIRINDQWRIVFRWTEGGPSEVRICDYH